MIDNNETLYKIPCTEFASGLLTAHQENAHSRLYISKRHFRGGSLKEYVLKQGNRIDKSWFINKSV